MSDIKILLVDDRDDNLLSIESIFALDDYRIVKANSGRQALQILLKDQNFNLILMDVKMPGLSGFETASLIYEREKLKEIPIIFITAHSYNEESVYEGYKAGAVDYIYKPIKPELLRSKVAVFIDLYKKTQALVAQELELRAINKNLESEIKERKQSEEQIIMLNKTLIENVRTLENVNAELARFAYVASHDLQEPLRKIQMYGDLLKTKYHDVVEDEGNYFIERMQTGAKRLQLLIRDILTYSRLTDSNISFTKSNLNQIVDEILLDLELRIKESDAKIFVSELPDLDVNPGQISQLLQNIISNALKFARKNIAPEIRITYEIGCAEGEILPNGKKYCHISICDNGIGFDESFLEQIFTLFKRLNDSSEYEGTGIGLAICKKIVEKHKGYIHAKSRLNEGSTFIISLPLTQAISETHMTKKHHERVNS